MSAEERNLESMYEQVMHPTNEEMIVTLFVVDGERIPNIDPKGYLSTYTWGSNVVTQLIIGT